MAKKRSVMAPRRNQGVSQGSPSNQYTDFPTPRGTLPYEDIDEENVHRAPTVIRPRKSGSDDASTFPLFTTDDEILSCSAPTHHHLNSPISKVHELSIEWSNGSNRLSTPNTALKEKESKLQIRTRRSSALPTPGTDNQTPSRLDSPNVSAIGHRDAHIRPHATPTFSQDGLPLYASTGDGPRGYTPQTRQHTPILPKIKTQMTKEKEVPSSKCRDTALLGGKRTKGDRNQNWLTKGNLKSKKPTQSSQGKKPTQELQSLRYATNTHRENVGLSKGNVSKVKGLSRKGIKSNPAPRVMPSRQSKNECLTRLAQVARSEQVVELKRPRMLKGTRSAKYSFHGLCKHLHWYKSPREHTSIHVNIDPHVQRITLVFSAVIRGIERCVDYGILEGMPVCQRTNYRVKCIRIKTDTLARAIEKMRTWSQRDPIELLITTDLCIYFQGTMRYEAKFGNTTPPPPETVSLFVRGEVCSRNGTIDEETEEGWQRMQRSRMVLTSFLTSGASSQTEVMDENDPSLAMSTTNSIKADAIETGSMTPSRGGTGPIFGPNPRRQTRACPPSPRAVFGNTQPTPPVSRKSPKRAVFLSAPRIGLPQTTLPTVRPRSLRAHPGRLDAYLTPPKTVSTPPAMKPRQTLRSFFQEATEFGEKTTMIDERMTLPPAASEISKKRKERPKRRMEDSSSEGASLLGFVQRN